MTSRIVLASSSPRRKALLQQIGLDPMCVAVAVDETPRAGEPVERYVARLAAAKSLGAAAPAGGFGLPVLGADTVVVIDDDILGKPRDRDHAAVMLKRLSGRRHRVLTAVSVRGRQHWQALTVTTVGFRRIGREEIDAYWETGEPADKAGAYAIQGIGAMFVEHIEGSYSGVVGLPLFETAALLERAGVSILRSQARGKHE